MTKQDGGRSNEDYLRQGSPTNTTFAETISRLLSGGDLAIAATGVELAVGVPLQAGETVTNITFITGGTAAGTPTAGYAVLRDPAGAKLAQTADFTTTARAANTTFTVPLTAPYTPTSAGLYYVGISFTAGTIPTLRGVSVGNAVLAGAMGLAAKVLAQSHGAAVAGVAPATIATPTTVAVIPYLVCT